MDMTFGEKLDRLCRTQGMTQKLLADRLGDVSPATVSNWVNGTFAPRITEAARIARMFEVSLDYLGFDEIEDILPAVPSDDQAILRLVRALRLDPDEALRRLAASPAVEAALQGPGRALPYRDETEADTRRERERVRPAKAKPLKVDADREQETPADRDGSPRRVR